MQSANFEATEYKTAQAPESNMYYAIFKVPAKKEDGTALKGGDTCYFEMQINDLRSLEDVDNFFCSGGLMEYDTLWKFLVLGGK